jgi:hypothetical protein
VSTSALEQDVKDSLSQKRQKIDEVPVENSIKVVKKAYLSLSSERSQQLDEYIAKLKQRKSQQVAISQSSTDKTRQNVRDNFLFALLLGIAERQGESLDFEIAEKDCRLTAIEIEAAMFVYFKHDIGKEYGRKFRLL